MPADADGLTVVTLAQRPDLVDAVWDMPDDWPEFMNHDLLGDVLFGLLPVQFPEHQLAGLDGDGRVMAKVNSIPFAWSGADEDLPVNGWDGVLHRGFRDHRCGTDTTAVSLLEARVAPELRGRGLSRVLLTAARENARRLGARDLLGPVRPTGKSARPRVTMRDYVNLVRGDGLPVDPWLRTHVRLGGRIVAVCPTSMVVTGTLDQWRAWTGLPFEVSGELELPGALVPVQVQAEHGTAVHVEPNVWVHHDLRGAPPSNQP